MLRFLYNALWYPALPFALMAGGTRGRQDRRERMGKMELASDRDRPRIWIHASSVGEVEAIRSVAHGLLREFESARLIVTTMTPTGRDAARRRIPGAEVCALAPLDCRAVVRRFIRRVKPHLLIIVETELWPNYFIEAKRAGARVVIVNGRISKRSAARYHRAKRLFGPALRAADLILVQTVTTRAAIPGLGPRANGCWSPATPSLILKNWARRPYGRPCAPWLQVARCW